MFTKSTVLFLRFAAFGLTRAWAGDELPTPITNKEDIAMIFVNTNLAAATGAILAMITSWIRIGKPDVGMSLNGALAGLVAITAPCASVSPLSAVIISAQLLGIGACFAWTFPLSSSASNELAALSLDGRSNHLLGGVTLSMAF